jgi:hypothetical protein
MSARRRSVPGGSVPSASEALRINSEFAESRTTPRPEWAMGLVTLSLRRSSATVSKVEVDPTDLWNTLPTLVPMLLEAVLIHSGVNPLHLLLHDQGNGGCASRIGDHDSCTRGLEFVLGCFKEASQHPDSEMAHLVRNFDLAVAAARSGKLRLYKRRQSHPAFLACWVSKKAFLEWAASEGLQPARLMVRAEYCQPMTWMQEAPAGWRWGVVKSRLATILDRLVDECNIRYHDDPEAMKLLRVKDFNDFFDRLSAEGLHLSNRYREDFVRFVRPEDSVYVRWPPGRR